MLAKFAGKCSVCGGMIAVGQEMIYNKRAKRGARGRHVTCDAGSQPQPTTQPSASQEPTAASPAPYVMPAGSMTAGDPLITGNSHACEARFNSVSHFVDYVRSRGPLLGQTSHKAEYRTEISEGYGDQQWLGVPSHPECMRAIDTGWTAGADAVKAIRDQLEVTAPKSVRRVRKWSDSGNEFDIHRAYSGRLDSAWSSSERTSRTQRRVITLVASMQGLSHTPDWIYFARGAAVLATADALSAAGYDVAIEAEYRVIRWLKGAPDAACKLRVPVKESRMPADVASLAATVALVGFKRTYGFSALLVLAEQYGATRTAGAFASQRATVSAPNEFSGFDSFDTQLVSSEFDGPKFKAETKEQAALFAAATAQRIIRAIEEGCPGGCVWPTDDPLSTDYIIR